MIGIVDIHAHILPGIDDGSRDWDESRRMLEEAYSQGIRYIVATPHYSRRGLPKGIYESAAKLKEEAQRMDPAFMIGLGQETYYHDGLIDNLKNGTALTLEGSRYVLVEFDPQVPYDKLFQAVRKLAMARYIPVIAHMERYVCLRKEKNLSEVMECGCKLQMNFSSLEGSSLWNREARWCRSQIIDGRIDCLGTDMHRMDVRRPDIRESFEWLMKHVEARKLEALLCGNAYRLLQKEKRETRDTYGKDL